MTRPPTSSPLRRLAAALAALCCVAAPLGAQDEGGDAPDPQELMRQIRRNLVKIEDELQKVRAESAATADAAAKKDLDRLIDLLRRRQEQVTKDIDEIIKQMKSQEGGGGSSSSESDSPPPKGSQGKKPSSKNRNKSEGGKDDKSQGDKKRGDKSEGGKEQGDKEGGKDGKPEKGEDGEGSKPEGGKPEPNGGDPKDGPPGSGRENNAQKGGAQENRDGANPKQPAGRKVVQVQINEIWGRLPAEQRQKLVDRNFKDYTPEYEDEIREYLRRTNLVGPR